MSAEQLLRRALDVIEADQAAKADLDAARILIAVWDADIDDGFKVSDNFDALDPLFIAVERIRDGLRDREATS